LKILERVTSFNPMKTKKIEHILDVMVRAESNGIDLTDKIVEILSEGFGAVYIHYFCDEDLNTTINKLTSN